MFESTCADLSLLKVIKMSTCVQYTLTSAQMFVYGYINEIAFPWGRWRVRLPGISEVGRSNRNVGHSTIAEDTARQPTPSLHPAPPSPAGCLNIAAKMRSVWGVDIVAGLLWSQVCWIGVISVEGVDNALKLDSMIDFYITICIFHYVINREQRIVNSFESYLWRDCMCIVAGIQGKIYVTASYTLSRDFYLQAALTIRKVVVWPTIYHW